LSDHANPAYEQLEQRLAQAQQRIKELEALSAPSDTETQLRTLIDNVPGVSYRCACDEYWTMEFISTEIENLSGYPPTDFQQNRNRTYASIIHPDDVELVNEAVSSGVQKKHPYTIEYRVIHKDGSIHWVYEKGQGIFSEAGELLWLDGVILDVTDKKMFGFAQEQSEIKFQNVIDSSPIPYALNDKQNNVNYLNPAFINTFGYDLTDIPTLADWWPKAYPDEKYRVWVANTWQQHIETARKNNAPFEPLEIVIQCKDKSKKTVLASVAPLSGTYDDVYLVILYDITEHTEIRQKLNNTVTLLENIVNSTPDLIFVKNNALQTIFCNEAHANALGKSRKDMYGNTDIENGWNEELVNGNPEKGIRGFIHDDRDALSGIEVHNPHDPANIEGEVRIFDTHKLPLKDANDDIIGVLGVARDITERKNTEDQLRQSQKMDALGKLTGGIAHDFNNLLGVILGYSELLKNELPADSSSCKYIQEIYIAGDRAKILTSKLLTFSRKQCSNSQICQINDLLERDFNMLEKTLTAKIKISLHMDKQLWTTFINEEMLGGAILNICINSMHAMPDGGSLDVTTRNIHLNHSDTQTLNITPGDYVQLTIKDNGSGMSQNTQEHIFEPFFSTKGESGTGLGMSQVYGFIKQSNGDIQVSSKLDLGTSINMYFPRHFILENTPETKAHSVTEILAAGKETILVVDDEKSLRTLAAEILDAQNYCVLTAENAAQALDILDIKSVDLLLSDVIMPGMDGYQLAIEAHAKQPELKIQMVSGYNDKHNIKGADAVLQQQQINKPYSKDILLNRIRDLLDGNEI
jgi:PAS domain S-box-containing protein